MNFKQFRKAANGHSRTAIAGGRVVGGRGFRLMSKLGQTISVQRLEQLLAEAHQQTKEVTMRERFYWQVCFERDGVWDCIGSHETRAEAEAELRSVKSTVWPNAFLVRLTLTRMDQARATGTLTMV